MFKLTHMKNFILHFLIPVIIVALFFWGVGYLIVSLVGWEFNMGNWSMILRTLYVAWCLCWLLYILNKWGKDHE